MKSLSDVSPSKICSEHLIANIHTVVYDRCAANVTLLTTCEIGISSSFMLELIPNKGRKDGCDIETTAMGGEDHAFRVGTAGGPSTPKITPSPFLGRCPTQDI